MSKPKFETLYPPRGMRAERAAAYLSISTSLFYKMVEDERMPPPVKVGAASIWDRVELDAAFDNLKDGPGGKSSLKRTLRELRKRVGNAKSGGSSMR